MAIKILSTNDLKTAKYNAVIKKYEDIQDEMVDHIKNALDHVVDIDYLYDIKNYIDQLLIDWQDQESELDEGEDYE